MGSNTRIKYDFSGLQKLVPTTYGHMKKRVDDVANDLARIAKTTTAPIDKGDLRRAISAESGFWFARAIGNGYKIMKRVVAATDYALIQHEEDFKHPNGGQRYYLTGPLSKNRKKYSEYIQGAVPAALREVAMK